MPGLTAGDQDTVGRATAAAGPGETRGGTARLGQMQRALINVEPHDVRREAGQCVRRVSFVSVVHSLCVAVWVLCAKLYECVLCISSFPSHLFLVLPVP